ncbi:MAG: sigma-70 family RNA polymerase sigma factor [Solirubrobacteraceae bacterium]|nr:sigma-70 family RNA polymerase sigma factor [Patulibacter sp.]
MDHPLDRLGDAALIAATRTDPEAFAALYRRYERPVLAYFVRRVRSADLAADLTAETFAGALASLRRDAGPGGDPAAWLFGIARIKLVELHRRGYSEDAARRLLAMDPVDLDDGQLDAIDQLAQDDAVEELVSALPAPQREAVVARILDDRDYGAIAADLDVSEATVRQRVSRGLAALRIRIEGTR